MPNPFYQPSGGGGLISDLLNIPAALKARQNRNVFAESVAQAAPDIAQAAQQSPDNPIAGFLSHMAQNPNALANFAAADPETFYGTLFHAMPDAATQAYHREAKNLVGIYAPETGGSPWTDPDTGRTLTGGAIDKLPPTMASRVRALFDAGQSDRIGDAVLPKVTGVAQGNDLVSVDPASNTARQIYHADAPVQPQSPLGKLAADLKAGRISPDEYQAGVAKETQLAGSGDDLIEVADPSSPTGVRLIPKREASGMPGMSRSRSGLSPAFQGEQQLRGEFMKYADQFTKVRDAFGRVNASASDPSAAGDMSLIFAYQKLLDPGSVVREGEFAQTAATGAFGDRVKAAVLKVAKGERLDPAMRADFVNRANKLYAQQKAFYDASKNRYSGLATEYGYDPTHVVYDMTQGVQVPQVTIQGGTDLRAKYGLDDE